VNVGPNEFLVIFFHSACA